ncbi:MAG: Gfo/Idh/MocA family oxidoreductase [Acidobacteriaceae bacterium]|jgi:predicted dehydrogenase
MSLKIAIVGCGKIADAHVEEISKIPSVRLSAVCDLEPIMAEQLAARYSISRWYSDVASMLEQEKPDILHITTPPQSHLSLTKQAVAAGCHVFLEKPVALRHADTEAILAAVTAGGRKLAVNYWPNFEAPALELRRLLEAGTLGSPVHVESFYGYNLEGEYGMALKRDPEHWVHRLPGKLFQNVLDHVLNKITPFLEHDRPFIKAVAYCGDAGVGEAYAGQLLDELRVVIQGARTSAYATFSAHARPIGHSLHVYGTKNTARVDFMARTIVLDRKQTFPSAVGRLLPPFLTAKDFARQGLKNLNSFAHARFHFFDGMRRLLTEFYLSIEQDSAPPIAYNEILQVSAMMDQIFEQVYPEVRV